MKFYAGVDSTPQGPTTQILVTVHFRIFGFDSWNFLDEICGGGQSLRNNKSVDWPGGGTVLSGGLRSLIASGYHCMQVSCGRCTQEVACNTVTSQRLGRTTKERVSLPVNFCMTEFRPR